MLLPALLLFSSALLNTKPAPVFADIRIGADGPYRFLVDTGSETTLLDRKLADTLHLEGEFRVAVVTQNGAGRAPAITARNLRLGKRPLAVTELVFYDLSELRKLYPSIRGVLGLNALAGIDFTLFPGTGRIEITTDRPAGESVPFYRLEGRIALKARMGDEVLPLILDSGSTHVVLFHIPAAMARTPSMALTSSTLEGARQSVPTTWTADMFFDRLRLPMLPAAIVPRSHAQAAGLLPASAFQAVHVDQDRHEVILVAKPGR